MLYALYNTLYIIPDQMIEHVKHALFTQEEE